MSEQSFSNVIVFGETGAGKSSVINMILGTDKAKVGNGLLGGTSRSTTYPVEINGKTYTLHDTVGLGEFSDGTFNDTQAVRNLYRLVADLSYTGGINLLVFVMKRSQKPTKTMLKHYHLFHHGFCDSKVPIVIVVDGHACVCAVKGPKTRNGCYRNEDRLEESATMAKQLIFQHCMLDGWQKPPIGFLKRFIGSIIDLFRSSRIPFVHTDLHDRLTSVFSGVEAEQIIGQIAQKP